MVKLRKIRLDTLHLMIKDINIKWQLYSMIEYPTLRKGLVLPFLLSSGHIFSAASKEPESVGFILTSTPYFGTAWSPAAVIAGAAGVGEGAVLSASIGEAPLCSLFTCLANDCLWLVENSQRWHCKRICLWILSKWRWTELKLAPMNSQSVQWYFPSYRNKYVLILQISTCW